MGQRSKQAGSMHRYACLHTIGKLNHKKSKYSMSKNPKERNGPKGMLSVLFSMPKSSRAAESAPAETIAIATL